MNKEQNKPTNPIVVLEEEVLEFWDRAKIFEQSVEREAPQGDYVFYDGPPFGTGEPHYGHILSSISKDVVPRYATMNGFRVERRWGWDCHGLPIENIIEKDLGISGKKQIEEIGVAKFNEACRSRVLEYADVWDVMIRRIGRWVDFKNSYKTMDLTYMESVWWAFKELWNKDLIYEGRKVLLYCPRCETPISNFEVAMDNSYKDITETSVYVKFKLKNPEKLNSNLVGKNVYIPAWTTTPWTLPGNVALAINSEIIYCKVKSQKSKVEELYILAKGRPEILGDEYEIVGEIKGKDLVGLEYEPLFDVPALKQSGKKVHYVAAADFVTTEDGTGVVHTAVVYGEDDYNLGLKLDLPIVPALDNKGVFNETVPQFNGVYFKKADKLIIEDLEKRGLLFSKQNITHSYPHCHRCETQLFYNAIPAWFLNINKVRQRMLETNEKISWYPDNLKYGRFAKGIEQAPDWNISRNRFFATPLPIWRCAGCGVIEVVGGVAELEEKSGTKGISDIHNHHIDQLTWRCVKCNGEMKRILEVFDCWVESGSMPFAQMHYPFENKEKFEDNFPAKFISEYISQTRAWFYVMHVVSTALFDSHSFENVVTTGVILNEKGEKLSKSKKNYPDPWKVINETGVDALRLYLMGSSVMHAESLFFNEKELIEVFRKNLMVLWNVYKFYEMYVDSMSLRGAQATKQSRDSNDKPEIATLPAVARNDSNNILDKWIIARLNQLIAEVTKQMEGYDLPRAVRPISDFINDLSTWYLRRSRERFKSDDQKDKETARATTQYVLTELSKVMAPFMPFIAEQIWQKVTGNNFSAENKSVHLEAWPSFAKASEGKPEVLDHMELARKIVEAGLAARDSAGIKIRQALPYYQTNIAKELPKELTQLITDELNILELKFGKEELGTELTEELKLDGVRRELVRTINNLRKNAGLTIVDRIAIYWSIDEADFASPMVKQVFEKFSDELKKDTLTDSIIHEHNESVDNKKEVKVNGEAVWLGIKKYDD